MECIRNGLGWIGYDSIGIQYIPLGTSPRPDARPGKAQRGTGRFHYNAGNETMPATSLITEAITMAQCAYCGAELKPPVRAPHTVYVKSLYRIAGQDYCRHHIISAAVAAGSMVKQTTEDG